MYYIAIDSGTTNSRIRLVDEENNRILDVIKKSVGVKNSAIDGNTMALESKLAEGLQEIIRRNQCEIHHIRYIIASGMITSNLGLCEVPHVEGPSRISDFAKAATVKTMQSFLNIPCIFVPGMKNQIEPVNQEHYKHIHQYDVMRGEEVETFGLLRLLNLKGNGFMILPGSHTKCVAVENGEISSVLSTLSGEILQAISQNTILTSSLNCGLITSIAKKPLIAGYKASVKFGLSRSLYHIRLLHLFDEMNENERANYFVGAVLASDINAMMEMYKLNGIDWIVIGGENKLRKAFCEIFSYLNFTNIIETTDEQAEQSTVIGSRVIGDMVELNVG
ncbi:2-dehydro-3-deoxygalactonokinase [Bacillus sp. PS06]|uniref:2-dehydro-3-deoxygalactonokinase n=1 Tax=Bacillus sp. PS06 TaxID=2764176 RepID=UPI001783841D|nr:2-dehydro-3-deoxygalactonokinase [Bacillus sp. PS06]MBD8068633.1 2-dehydro-3-deoxygalactonokinase [Bacillus sp. PS06]